jgi:hypothetical protein
MRGAARGAAVPSDIARSRPSRGVNMRISTAVAASALAAVATLGTAGRALAAGPGGQFDIRQSSQCLSHDLNVDVLGQVGLLNGLLGNALNSEGNPGAQSTHHGVTMGCNNSAF